MTNECLASNAMKQGLTDVVILRETKDLAEWWVRGLGTDPSPLAQDDRPALRIRQSDIVQSMFNV